MVRVLHVLPRFRFGGIPVMIMNLYRRMNREQVQFDFVVFTKEHGVFNDEIEAMGGKIFYIPKCNGKNVLSVRRAWNSFFKEHPEYKILHSHVRSTAFLYIPIAKKHGLITIEHSHSTSNGSGIGSIMKYLFQLPLRNQADYLFACSDIAGQWLFGKNVLTKTNYKMIPNGIMVQEFVYSEKTRSRLRKELGIKTELVIGHSGRFHEAKNHRFLLDVFAQIKKSIPDSKLLLVGDGDLRSLIENYSRQLGISESIIITGMIKDVAPYYSVMDVFVFPSLWEGLPVSVVEAQASGLPCLVSDTVTKEVMVSELVEYYSLEQESSRWANEIITIYNKFKNRDRTLIDKRLGKFDSEYVARDLADFYKHIAKGK